MAEKIYNWTDDPMVSGVVDCNTDVVNDCLMHLKYENTSDAIQNMYETGQVEKQSRAFNQLLSMKRSTFDKSKFTVVGSPTITDDGVASGFSSSNYVKKDNVITIGSNGEFHIDFKFNCEHYTNYQYILDLYKTISDEIVIRRNIDDSYQCICFVSGEAIFNKRINIAEDYIEGYIEYKNNTYTLKINNSIETLISSVKMRALDYSLTLGCRGASPNIQPLVNGSIDLKAFSITVDGNEVLNGNKTGLDVIKPDNYTIVGSPVISDDGVASGFSNDNYLSLPVTTFGNKFKIVSSFSLDSLSASVSTIYSGQAKQLIALSVQNKRLAMNIGNGNSWVSGDVYGITTLEINKKYLIMFQYENGKYSLYLSVDNGASWKQEVTYSSSSQIIPNNVTLKIGQARISGSPFIGSIDLNSFKIYVDGNLVYQPCLKIPYTQSKTGSKIVDGIYRDRVWDVYEQFGTASYYTHDETNQNFTLPMGEIYGMIERKSDADMLNNPFTFGMSQYYKGEMKNLSWLKSYGQEYFKNGHPDFYNWVLTNANAGKKGFKLSTATDITDYDFVVNPTKETFILPLKNGQEGIFASGAKGNGKALVVTDGNGNERNLFQPGNDYIFTNDNVAGNLPHVTASYSGTQTTSYALGTNVGLTTDSSKSGIVVDTTVPQGWNLYYYVGETVEGANLIKAGEVWEEISNKADVSYVTGRTQHYVIERFLSDDGLSWYTLWSDNWLEQGGVLTGGGDYNRTVTFLKEFANANYTILKNSGGGGSGGVAERWMGFWGLTTTSAVTGYINHSERWYACGYAKGEN